MLIVSRQVRYVNGTSSVWRQAFRIKYGTPSVSFQEYNVNDVT